MYLFYYFSITPALVKCLRERVKFVGWTLLSDRYVEFLNFSINDCAYFLHGAEGCRVLTKKINTVIITLTHKADFQGETR